jgi:transposase
MMGMRQRTFQLSDEAARALLAVERATDDAAYRTRLQAVRLYGLGYTSAQITDITGCPRSTLMLWCRLYRSGGSAALSDHRAGGTSAKLSREQIADLSSKLRRSTPRSLLGPDAATTDGQAWTVAALRRAVQQWYGVTYQSVVSYYTLFDRCNYSFHQPTEVFKSRNEAAVMEFETLLEKN